LWSSWEAEQTRREKNLALTQKFWIHPSNRRGIQERGRVEERDNKEDYDNRRIEGGTQKAEDINQGDRVGSIDCYKEAE
jgi:hypothetical protein